MIVQNPNALWGLLLLAIPIIVHLFDFRRVKRIPFSNVTFLQVVQRQNTPRRRWKNFLILSARLLTLFFLIMVFAGPILPSGNERFYSNDHLLVIDNSRSMDAPCADNSCFEAAKMMSIEMAKSFEQGRFFYQGTHRLKRFVGSDELSTQLDEVEWSKQKFKLQFEEDELAKSQLTVLSDFQPRVVSEVERLAADSIPMLLFPLNQTARQNLYVDSVFLQNPLSIGENKRIMGVTLTNSGNNEVENALVRIYNADQQLSSVVVTLDAHASENVFFEIEQSNESIYRVEVEDYEVDFDNEYFFSLPSFNPIKIAILGGMSNRPIEAIFENSDYFDLEVYPNSSIDFERFFSSDLVIIHSFDVIPEWFDVERLAGDLIVIPTPTLDATNYSIRLGFRVHYSGGSSFSPLKMSGFEHPFFEGIFDELDSKGSFPKVKNLFQITGTNDVLLRADSPFLQKVDGEHKIYWFNSPLEEEFSELQNHALFLPIMYRIAENSKGFNEAIAYTLSDAPLQVELPRASNELLELKGANGQFIPSSYFNQSALVLTLPTDLNEPGYYYLTAGTDTLKVLALNLNREESVIDGMNADELTTYFQAYPNVLVLASNSPETLQANLSELSDGKQLWKYALLLALLFLIAETALHRWLK